LAILDIFTADDSNRSQYLICCLRSSRRCDYNCLKRKYTSHYD